MKKYYQKWWFWLIAALLILGIIGGAMEKTEETNVEVEKYISKYEWNLKDTKIGEAKYDDGTSEDYKYVVLGVENKDGDLEAGEYIIKTNDNSKASFMIYITDQYYEKDSDIPNTYDGMVQGFDKSEYSAKLTKGQYLYLVQNSNGQGKVIVTKKH